MWSTPRSTQGVDRGGVFGPASHEDGLEHSMVLICGVPLTAVNATDAVDVIIRAAMARRPLTVHLCNAYTLSLVDREPRLRQALVEADLNLPDGTPVAWLLRRRGVGGPTRGPELVRQVVRRGSPHGLRHVFWGGAPGVAAAMTKNLSAAYPDAIIGGYRTPPFRDPSDEELQEVATWARESSAHVIWVGLGTPKQDYVVTRLATFAECPVVPVGAAFDFLAGSVKEAPAVWQGSGLEWVYRLAREPRRLWRRYLFGNVSFIVNYVKHRRDGSSPLV